MEQTNNNIVEQTNNTEEQNNINDELPVWQYVLIYLVSLIGTFCLIFVTIYFYDLDDIKNMFIKKSILYVIIIAITWFNGYVLVGKFNVRVNYTRKINHMLVWSFPFIIDEIYEYHDETISLIWNMYFAMICMVLWMEPTRRFDCTNILENTFKSLDRPEDRPNSLKWLFLQNVGVVCSLLPFGILWSYWGTDDMLLIPIIAITFGDGLAEPVGIKFGKHKYNVRAIGTNNVYTRSYEGSFMVYFATLVSVILVREDFGLIELIINIVCLPFISAFSEAISPHSLDNPIIIASISSFLSLVHFGVLLSPDNVIMICYISFFVVSALVVFIIYRCINNCKPRVEIKELKNIEIEIVEIEINNVEVMDLEVDISESEESKCDIIEYDISEYEEPDVVELKIVD